MKFKMFVFACCLMMVWMCRALSRSAVKQFHTTTTTQQPPQRTAGMSGCQRLCSGLACSQGCFLMSTLMSGVGVRGAILGWGLSGRPAAGGRSQLRELLRDGNGQVVSRGESRCRVCVQSEHVGSV